MPTQNKPVYRGVVSVSLFLLALLLIAMPATAFTGYLETFNDSNDSGGAIAGEPTAWYTAATSTVLGTFLGGYGTMCAISPASPACGTGQNSETFSLATPATGSQSYYLNYTETIHRRISTTQSSILQYLDAPGARDTYNFLFADSTHVRYNRGFCTSPADVIDVFIGAGPADQQVTNSVSIHFDAVANTITITDSSGAAPCSYTATSNDKAVADFRFIYQLSTSQGTNLANSDYGFIDNLVWNNGAGSYTLPTTPTAPAGLTAHTLNACTLVAGSYTSTVELRWPLSSNDPDQTIGAFQYNIYLNGANVGVDSITGQDGSAHRYAAFTVSGNSPTCDGNAVFWIVASDRGLVGPASCSVQINDNTAGQTHTCGSGSGGISSDPAANTGNPLGQMVQTLNTAWGFDWSWIIGAIIMALCVAAVWMMGDFVVALVIFLVAVANAKLGLWPEWSIFAIVFISIAMAGNRLFGKKGENADGDSA